ncbi:hypothetical protein CR51_31875 [Caballeronia megalochromosomata]|nr:hypothetical protein CR51_31875 [Caballeronia megalochromosomata]
MPPRSAAQQHLAPLARLDKAQFGKLLLQTAIEPLAETFAYPGRPIHEIPTAVEIVLFWQICSKRVQPEFFLLDQIVKQWISCPARTLVQELLGVGVQFVDDSVQQLVAAIADIQVFWSFAKQNTLQCAYCSTHCRTRTKGSVEDRLRIERKDATPDLPFGWQRRQEVIDPAAFTIQLGYILRFSAA